MGKQSTTHPYRPVLAALCLALMALLSRSAQAQNPTIQATTIPLILPTAVVFDAAGNLYIAETGNHVIRKVDPQGRITTIAGTTTQGFSGDNGPATLAQLDSPQGLALTSTTLYIADTHNHRIRALNLATNTITTVAGTTPGYSGDNAQAATAQLNLPTALALDANQNLYLADTSNHRIRRIDAASQTITTVAGNGTQGSSGDQGPALAASIDSPQGIAVDTTGNVYLADTHNHRIRRIDAATHTITTVTPPNPTQLALPQGLTLDAQNNLYLADTASHRILRIDATTGLITTVAGTGTQGYSGDTGPATEAALDSPRAVALTPTAQLTLADTHNQRIREITSNTIQTIAGLGSTSPGTLTLSAPTVISYGTGTLIATLNTPTTATGSITLLDTYTSSTQIPPVTSTLATLALTSNLASFATTTLPVGTHTLLATYLGDLTHASTQSTAFTLTITPAPTLTTLSTPASTALPITLSATVTSTTAGTPTGALSLLDGTSPIATTPLTPPNPSTLLIPTLTPGTHTLTASYAGASNFQPSTSAPISITISPTTPTPVDFTIAATGATSQTVLSGTTATFNFATQTQGQLSSPITLTVTGLPQGATATFNPAYLPPGQTSNTFTLAVTTLKASIAGAPVTVAIILTLPIFWTRRRLQLVAIAWISAITFTLTACGDRIATTNSQATHPPTPYTILVTGTATSPTGTTLSHTAYVTLTVQ